MDDGTTTGGHVDRGLFSCVIFTIIPAADLSPEHADQIRHELEREGATYSTLDVGLQRGEAIKGLTHIIATTSDFPGYFHALDSFIHVVKPRWVSRSRQLKRLDNPRSHSPDPGLFMSEVFVTCASNIPSGDRESIEECVLAVGGRSSDAVTKMTTHLVALSLDDDKCRVAEAKGFNCKVVLPHWFDDCLKLRRRIADDLYRLPNPRVLLHDTKSPKARRHCEAITDAVTPVPQDLPVLIASPAASDAPAPSVFSGKRMLLSSELNISSRIREAIETLVRVGGGVIVADVEQADTYVCPYRDGGNYICASRAGKDVGNLSWLYYLIIHNRWTSPMRRLLHYPIPRGGIPDFSSDKISISNYAGEARVYVESLIKACGAEYTNTLQPSNTHLVAAHPTGEKCDAASEWNINQVNHLWLEESYAKCKKQSLTNSRYTHFPRGTNLSEVVGQTQIDRDAIEKYYKPANEAKVRVNGNDGGQKKAQSDAPIDEDTRGTAAGRDASSKTKLGCGEGSGAALGTHVRVGERNENETPSTDRGAKSKALSALHSLAPDIARYEKEARRKGGVVYGGRRERDDPVNGKVKRPPETEDGDEQTGRPKVKKVRTADTPVEHFLMLSGDDRWVDAPRKQTEDENKLRALGIRITESPEDVTILCAPSIVRTKKFVAALSNAPTVVCSAFLDACLAVNEIPPPESFLLSDEKGEQLHQIKLAESIARAKKNRRRLLSDWKIFVTPHVKGGFEAIRDIVAANGGECLRWRGQSSSKTTGWERAGSTLYLVSSTEPDDVKLWPKFREMARKASMKARIVKHDWVIFVAMAQEVKSNDQWELKDGETLDANVRSP